MASCTRQHLVSMLCTTVALGLLAVPSSAKPMRDPAAAEALFNQALTLIGEGQLQEACSKLEESQRLDPASGTLLYLGQCYEKLGRTASAWAAYKQAESSARETARLDRARIAAARAEALEPNLSKLVVRVAKGTDLPGIEIARDGTPVGRAAWGSPIPVDPGVHVVTATARDRRPWKREVQIPASGATIEVVIQHLEVAPASPPPSATTVVPPKGPAPSPDHGTGEGQRVAGLVVVGAGVVALGVGAFYGLKARAKNAGSEDYCLPEDPSRCYQRGVELNSEAKSAATNANIGFIAGGFVAGIGLTIYFTAPSSRSAESTGQRVRLSPALGGDVAGLAVDGAW